MPLLNHGQNCLTHIRSLNGQSESLSVTPVGHPHYGIGGNEPNCRQIRSQLTLDQSTHLTTLKAVLRTFEMTLVIENRPTDHPIAVPMDSGTHKNAVPSLILFTFRFPLKDAV